MTKSERALRTLIATHNDMSNGYVIFPSEIKKDALRRAIESLRKEVADDVQGSDPDSGAARTDGMV